MNASDFADDIRGAALSNGADFFGIAEIGPVHDAVVAQGGESLAKFSRAVAIGIALPNETVDLLTQHHDECVPPVQRPPRQDEPETR